MPKVKGKEFPYTPAGFKEAAKARKSMPKPKSSKGKGKKK